MHIDLLYMPSGSVQTQFSGDEDEGTGCQKKQKRIRVSKKEIPDYKWTEEGTKRLAEFVKNTPQLYDKTQKDWLNVIAKAQLWTKAGKQLEPPATGKCSFLSSDFIFLFLFCYWRCIALVDIIGSLLDYKWKEILVFFLLH